MSRFAGKRILITGGTRGIGRAGARAIRDAGGTVLVTGRGPDLPDLGPGVEVLADDAADPDTGIALAARAGALDGLWLNAARAEVAPPEALTPEGFDRLIALNLRGPMLQFARLQGQLRPGASVVVTASSSAYEGAADTALYGASKAGLIAAVRSWARAMAPRGIRVNALVPGPVATAFRDALDPALRAGFEAAVMAAVPLGRPGLPEEAAEVALFLLSDASAYVTGSQYAVDGGMLMR
ncbi:SDR family oxidoreductase [Pseudooceanicola sp. CBS1P-1]|uniref:SDR family oxidoreductase n=1 Tax=Pseudooceanicola albus TaxID=2692189 RepID=A0A6L7G8E7_9RHOB|nr:MULTISPECIES: SDR family oxidoreductase [Pseudooceanicola]MBT9386286.1 SDR family oxidoreductase [Pseudooceanicola endophyticus]MXN20335.1 SDR family oxidoreductase [Pseudooceanicola albus]